MMKEALTQVIAFVALSAIAAVGVAVDILPVC